MTPADYSAAALSADDISSVAFGARPEADSNRNGLQLGVKHKFEDATFSPLQDPIELMEVALDAISSVEEEDRALPVRALARVMRTRESHEEEDSGGFPIAGLIQGVKTISKYVLEFGYKVAKTIARWGFRLVKEVIFKGGQFLVRGVLIPLLEETAGFLSITPFGLGALLAGGALAYVLYRVFFKHDGAKEAVESSAAKNRLNTDGSLNWDSIGGELGLNTDSSGESTSVHPMTGAPDNGPALVSRPTSRVTDVASAKAFLAKNRSASIEQDIQIAAQRTGMDVGVLNAFAAVESTFHAVANPGTSEAQGLFQFIPSTWATTVSAYGAMYGVDRNANRNDPLASSIMAAAYLKHVVYPAISRVVARPSAVDLYFGHFLGPAGGAKFLRNMQANPGAYAYLDFNSGRHSAVAANQKVFFKDGDPTNPRTYAEIYAMFSGKMNAIQEAATEIQSAEVPSAGPPITSVAPTPPSADLGADSAMRGPGTATPVDPPSQFMQYRNTVVRAPA